LKNKDTLAPKKQGNRILSLRMLFVGCVFLCNPNLNLFDLLPDAVGYGLLLLAVRRASEVFQHFDTAYCNFQRLFWINIAKVPAILVMMYITGTNAAERGLITVFALSFAVLEWIFALPAFRALFEGFTYLGEREGVLCTLRTQDGKSVDKLSLLSIAFLIVKGACSFLPELVFLSSFEYNGSLEIGAVNPKVFYPFFTAVGLIVSLVVGLIWIFALKSYFGALRRDEQMQDLLAQKASLLADELCASDEKRRRRTFFFFLSAGFVFAVDPLIGNRDLLPNAFAALAFFFAFALAENEAASKKGKLISLIYLALSVAENVLSASFFARFKLTDIAFRDAALGRYIPVVGLRLLESAFFFLCVLLLMALLRQFVLTHTGRGLRPQDLVIRNEVHATLLSRIKRLSVFSVIYALLRPISAVLMTVTTSHVVTEEEANQFYSEGETVYSSAFSWLWILLLVLGVALAVYAFYLIKEIKSESSPEATEKVEE